MVIAPMQRRAVCCATAAEPLVPVPSPKLIKPGEGAIDSYASEDEADLALGAQGFVIEDGAPLTYS